MNKANIFFLITILGLQLLAPSIVHSEQLYREFAADQYNSKEFKISQRNITHGKINLRIIQAKKLIHFTDSPNHCRAWFDVIKSKKNVFQRYYDDVGPVGFSFGLFVPKVQPPSPYLAVIKNGDYDGRLLLVRNDGKVHDLMGGFYFITKDKRYLFSQYASDIEGLVVFDLKTDRIVFSSDNIPYIHQWYIYGEDYFFTESEWIKTNLGKPTEKGGVAYFYDFNTHQIIPKNMTATEMASAKALVYDFDPRGYEDCITVPNKSIKRDASKSRHAP
jgi:hypothetical protein